MRGLCIALFLLTACGTSSTPAASVSALPSPSPVPSGAPTILQTPEASPFLGVFYDATAGTLALVDSNGAVVASGKAIAPHRFHQGLPWTSTTLKRLYYLDQAGTVHFLSPDGSAGITTHLGLAAGEEAGFSVSPDDGRIAVAVLRYGAGPTYLGMTLYVESLGGGPATTIFSSSVTAEFPIAWTGGRLIAAVTTAFCCRSSQGNPYGAAEYHVVDPATGNRLVTLCRGTRGPVGPPATIGVSCLPTYDNGPVYFHWDGSPCCAPGTAAAGALSPDGNAGAWGDGTTGIRIAYGPNSAPGVSIDNPGVFGDVEAWLDTTHLVYRLKADSGQYIGLLPGLHGPKIPDSGPGTSYLGTLPAAIS